MKKKKKKISRGLMAPMQPDDRLAAVVGSKPKTRGKVMKRLWAYIKEHNLQSKKNGQIILAMKDKKFRKLMGKDKINMLKMAGVVSRHLEPAEEE